MGSEPDELFTMVRQALEWGEGVEMIRGVEVPRPRLVAAFGTGELPAGLEMIGEMSEALSNRYGAKLERITCNLYRDGRDSVAWHGDTIGRSRTEDTMVAIVSFGSPRKPALRSRRVVTSRPASRSDMATSS